MENLNLEYYIKKIINILTKKYLIKTSLAIYLLFGLCLSADSKSIDFKKDLYVAQWHLNRGDYSSSFKIYNRLYENNKANYLLNKLTILSIMQNDLKNSIYYSELWYQHDSSSIEARSIYTSVLMIQDPIANMDIILSIFLSLPVHDSIANINAYIKNNDKKFHNKLIEKIKNFAMDHNVPANYFLASYYMRNQEFDLAEKHLNFVKSKSINNHIILEVEYNLRKQNIAAAHSYTFDVLKHLREYDIKVDVKTIEYILVFLLEVDPSNGISLLRDIREYILEQELNQVKDVKLADLASKYGYMQDAELIYKKSIAKDIDVAYANYKLAEIYAQQNLFEESIKYYLKVNTHPLHISAYKKASDIQYYVCNSKSDALETLLHIKAYSVMEKFMVVDKIVAMCLENNDIDEAKIVVSDFLFNYPNNKAGLALKSKLIDIK